MSQPSQVSPPRRILLWPFALGLILYGHHLGDGYLADDFLYLQWLEQGIPELLRRVTWHSDPQMIRPLPAFAWTLSWLPGGAAWQHGMSLLLHCLAGGLLARRIAAEATLRSGSGWASCAGCLFGGLFVACPLLVEPVIWLSSATDLWATVLALLCLDLAFPPGSVEPPTGRRLALAGFAFMAALLSKETVLLLPFLALALLPGRRHPAGSWRPHVVLTAIFVGYLAGRWLLFGGPGGYLEADGSSRALSFDPAISLRNIGLQLPWRLLFPLIRSESLPWPLWGALGLMSLTVAAGFALASLKGRSPTFTRLRIDTLLVGIALATAFLPVLPVFSVDSDHGGGRLLYWPLAVALWGVSRLLPWNPAQKYWGFALVVLWSLATLYNGTAWSEASRRLEATLRQLPAVSHQVSVASESPTGGGPPSGGPPTRVYIDGYDSWRGAYLWRNGFLAALARHGVGGGIDWRLGSGAIVEQNSDLGRRTHVWALDAELRMVDQTACERALVEIEGGFPWACDGHPRRCQAPAGMAVGNPADESPRLVSRRCQAPSGNKKSKAAEAHRNRCLAPSASATGEVITALRIRAVDPLNRPLEGRVLWRRGSLARFNISDSRAFRLTADRPRISMRLGPSVGPDPWQIQISLAEPKRLAEIADVIGLTLPEVCR